MTPKICEACEVYPGETNSRYLINHEINAEGAWICHQCEEELAAEDTCPCGCENNLERCVYLNCAYYNQKRKKNQKPYWLPPTGHILKWPRVEKVPDGWALCDKLEDKLKDMTEHFTDETVYIIKVEENDCPF